MSATQRTTPQPGPACPGRRSAVTSRLVGICIACAKLRAVGPFGLAPEAAMNPRRVWGCANFAATRGPAGA